MRRIMRALRLALRPPISDPRIRSHEEVEEMVARGVVRRTATSSIRLQRGQYVTKKDLDQEWERLKDVKFDEYI